MRYIFLAMLVFAALQADVLGQARAPEQAAVSFYRWYIGELNAERYPVSKQKRALLRRTSVRLGEWLYSPDYADYGADYFLDAQDWDETWVSNITASDVKVTGNTANLKVTLRPKKRSRNGLGMYVLHVKLVKEGGTWKIDRVENRKLI